MIRFRPDRLSFGLALFGLAPSFLVGLPTQAAESSIQINEVVGTKHDSDWVELVNNTNGPFVMTGWTLKDGGSNNKAYVIPDRTLSANEYLVLNEADFGFGLGESDEVTLYHGGTEPVDSFKWTAASKTSYGRCVNATGDRPWTETFAATKGGANSCWQPWPGTGEPRAADPYVDPTADKNENLSGLFYQPSWKKPDGTVIEPAILWAVRNQKPTLYCWVYDQTSKTWSSPTSPSWTSGKALYDSAGKGIDSEGVTKAELDSTAVYVSTEGEKPGVMRFDSNAAVTKIHASHEWDLGSVLKSYYASQSPSVNFVVGTNEGFEAITWVPDRYLTDNKFSPGGSLYDPDLKAGTVEIYPNHGTGLFLLGLEANGEIYAFALDHESQGAKLVTHFPSGLRKVMGLEFDRETGLLWAYCDDSCLNHSTVFSVQLGGTFTRQHQYEAASDTIKTQNNEGIALGPCVNNLKDFFWLNDGPTGGNALRQGSVNCVP